MSITAEEIARLAGVSRGTVDRALKNRAGVNPETKARVLSIAEKYNYKPNMIGKALVYSGKSVDIYVILNSVGNPFFNAVKEGISVASEEYAGYGIKIHLDEIKGYHADELLKRMDALPPEAKQLILTPICDKRVEHKLQQLIDSGVNVVMLTSKIEAIKNAVYVGCDYIKSGRIAGRLTGLLSAGKSNLFVVTGSTQHNGHAQRVEGIRQIISGEYPAIHFLGVSENLDDDDLAYSEMKKALKAKPEIDFVYITAGGVNGTLRALQEHNRSVRVCTFDDTPVTREALFDGSVSATVCQQPFEQGYQAVKAIFEKVIRKQEINGDIYSELSVKVDQSF